MVMSDDLDTLLAAQGGVGTTAQLLSVIGRARYESAVARGELAVVWTGVYGRADPSNEVRLRGLDLRAREPVALCLGTAATAEFARGVSPGDTHRRAWRTRGDG